MSASNLEALTNWASQSGAVREGPDSNTIVGHAKTWLTWLRNVKGRSERTIDSYGIILRQYIDWAEARDIEPLHPDITDLEGFVIRPRQRQGHGQMGAPATRRADVVVLSQFFGWLHERGHQAANPAADLIAPSVKPNMPKPIPDGDWLELWHAPKHPRLRLAMGLGFYCGLRRKEIASLRGDQLTDETIVSFVRKGGAEDTLPWRSLVGVYAEAEKIRHLAPDHQRYSAELQAHAQAMGPQRLFWTEGQQMHRAMTRLCARIGCPHYTPHQLRHSFITNVLRAGMPPHLVMAMANHTDFAMTRRYMKAGGSELDEWRRSRA